MTEEKQQQPMLSVERVYIKDSSFESPNSPHVFMISDAPEINVQISVRHGLLNEEDGLYEVVLMITATAMMEEKTVFLVELQQAGAFTIRNIPEDEMGKVLEIACPNILLPFAREVVNDFVGKGGFPQLLINPVNFEALYLQKQKQAASQNKH